jgi:hypothetical protein
METMQYNGLDINFHWTPGYPATRHEPGEQPDVEIESLTVSDWDEFSDIYGFSAKYLAKDLDTMLTRIEEIDYDDIYHSAVAEMERF